MRVLRMVVLAVALAVVGCGSSQAEPRFASWEPVSARLPPVADRARAKRTLAQSRRIWRWWVRHPAVAHHWDVDPELPYTYVRARQAAADRVEFTVVSVRADRPVLRSLVRIDPDRLAMHWDQKSPSGAQSIWTERGNELGSHVEGAPALTVDQLYERCEAEVLGGDSDHTARLYFHPNGVLMHCGIAWDECSDCPAFSIHSIGPHAVDRDPDLARPEKWLCSAPWGLFPPMAEDTLHSEDDVCLPAVPGRRYRPPRKPRPRTERSEEPPAEGLGSICTIDPEACPTGNHPTARWGPARPYRCHGGMPARAPEFLEIGKADPVAEWTFPFRMSGWNECGPERVRVRRVKPRWQ